MRWPFDRPWDSQPQGIATPHQRWLDRGLKSAYLLQPGIWQINLVTGKIGGTQEGTGVTFVNGKLRTPNAISNGALLEHGLPLNIALPVTLVVGWRRISGSGVAWSLLRTDSSQWTGWYGEGSGTAKSANSNAFDGVLTFGDTDNVALSHRAANSLVGYGALKGGLTDSAVTTPAAIQNPLVCLGYSRKSVSDNAAQADFTHFYAFQGALTDSELLELANEPQALFEPQRIPIPVAAAGGPSSQGLTPGLLTNGSTFYAPTVTRGAVTITPGLFSNSQAFYAPTVTQGAQTLTPGLFSNTQAFYAPAVSVGSVTLTPALFSNTSAFYAPSVTQDAQFLTPALLTNSQSFYAPTVTTGSATLTPGLFTNTNTFYAASVGDGTSAFIKYFDVLSGNLLILRALG